MYGQLPKNRFFHGFSEADLGHASLFLKLPCKHQQYQMVKSVNSPGSLHHFGAETPGVSKLVRIIGRTADLAYLKGTPNLRYDQGF